MSVDQLAGPLGQASELLTASLLADRKIMTCGAGPDAALAQLFTTSLLGNLERERPALPALNISTDGASLAAIGDAEGQEHRYSRQVQALGQAGDTLVLLNSGGGGARVLGPALQTALERDMQLVLVTHGEDSLLAADLPANSACLRVEASLRSQVIEIHTMVLLALGQLIEVGLFGPRE